MGRSNNFSPAAFWSWRLQWTTKPTKEKQGTAAGGWSSCRKNMKKKSLLAVAAMVVMCSATGAMAGGSYLGAAGGVSIYHDSDVSITGGPSGDVSYKTGYGFNLAAGYDFEPVRAEFEFGYKSAEIKDTGGVDTNIQSYMINAYYDFKNKTSLTPYVGAGVGMLNGELEDNGISIDDNAFGYQVMVGTAYNMTKNLALDLSYRFQGAANDFSKEGIDISYNSSNIYAGIRYTF